MSYDEGDCIKYDMAYFSQFESKIYISEKHDVESSDVFFTGRAKNRLPRLIECYDYLTSLSQKCLFIILNAPEDQKQKRDGIIYTDTPMTYRRMLEYSVNSKCLIEINQIGATGLTSRFIEAVMYNKLLITDNISAVSHPLFNEKYMKVVNSITEVDKDFFSNNENVVYDYHNEFSGSNANIRV